MTLTTTLTPSLPTPRAPRVALALLVGLVISALVALAGGVGRPELEALCAGLTSSAAPPPPAPPTAAASAGDELVLPPADPSALPTPGEGGR